MLPPYLGKGRGRWAGRECRIAPSGRFAAEFQGVIDEGQAFRRERLGMIDFPSLQSREGAFHHNEAVAAYALALLRAAARAGTLDGSGAVDEASLLAAALLHDVSKDTIDAGRINAVGLDGAKCDRLREDLRAGTLSILDQVGFAEATPVIDRLYRFEANGGAGTPAEVLGDSVLLPIAAPDIYDAMTAPKFYKGTSWCISGALGELLHLPACAASVRPLIQAFIDLMRPADFSPTPRRESGVIIR
ncbi:MAG: hypothetical protein FJX56_04840 [Alphaproteobacteria bacterium]|nr:hypothetical protein [Alphaproteobacteria bacterium]